MVNNRREPRLRLPGLQVEIRRAGWKPGSGYHSCRLVDLSPNGMAFVAHDNAMGPLDKIAFRLPVGAWEAEGRAVVCYRRAEGEGLWRYGAMFLEVNPDIGILLQEAEVDPNEVRAVARSLAEEMVLARCRTPAERQQLRRRMLLQEAVSAWLERLRELNCQLPVTMSVDHDGVLRIKGTDPVTILALPDRPGFGSDDGRYFASVFEVLEFLREVSGRA